MNYSDLSADAKKYQADYQRAWRKSNPDKARAAAARYWEKKAQEMFGSKYRPPKKGEEMSFHAKEAKKIYGAKWRAEHPGANTKNVYAYWERKAQELKKEGELNERS